MKDRSPLYPSGIRYGYQRLRTITKANIMEKENYNLRIMLEVSARLSQLPPTELIETIFKAAPANIQRYLITQREATTHYEFIRTLSADQYQTYEDKVWEIYKEEEDVRTPFIAILLEFYGKETHKDILSEMGYYNGMRVFNQESLVKLVNDLLSRHINCQVTWASPGKRAVVYIDNANFKQR
jgi:hypothetical protein